MVGAPRFELGTSWSRTKRATRLRHAPRKQQIRPSPGDESLRNSVLAGRAYSAGTSLHPPSELQLIGRLDQLLILAHLGAHSCAGMLRQQWVQLTLATKTLIDLYGPFRRLIPPSGRGGCPEAPRHKQGFLGDKKRLVGTARFELATPCTPILKVIIARTRRSMHEVNIAMVLPSFLQGIHTCCNLVRSPASLRGYVTNHVTKRPKGDNYASDQNTIGRSGRFAGGP